jgi:cytidylate kinase
MNPQFVVIGEDNTHKAPCLNGKVGAAGTITSPTLTGGISKLTINYTKMFTDTALAATVTITDLTTGTKYTHTISKTLDKNEKYVVYTEEWVLETPITGDFTIEIVNDCPSGATGNKDRMTILDIIWE